jgi:hypothetical protein
LIKQKRPPSSRRAERNNEGKEEKKLEGGGEFRITYLGLCHQFFLIIKNYIRKKKALRKVSEAN